MNCLVLTTSSACAGLAITDDQKTLFSSENPNQRTHSDWIHVALEEGLKKTKLSIQQIDHIALDPGPGSFTGIRVGFNLAKTLSFTQNLPLLTCSSLEILLAPMQGPAIAAMNAFRNLVYFCEKTADGQVGEPQCLPVSDVISRLQSAKKLAIIGDALQAYPELEKAAKPHEIKPSSLFPRVESLAEIARKARTDQWTKDWKSILPIYLRGSEAEEKAKS